ncbi:beta-N-acetylhexosaminidase [Polaribacter sp.]|uniref:beta-N-acetylhexosaminidase n=1 Tax=Polaribacter sp. TaxID=1920175 RepID=UPI0025CEF9A6|nr:beta-N-acetylhexosaminidase [Polaribacter sp.]
MMKTFFQYTIFLLLTVCVYVNGYAQIIPQPNQLSFGKDTFIISKKARLNYNIADKQILEIFVEKLEAQTGISIKTESVSKQKASIILTEDASLKSNNEGYELQISKNSIEIKAATNTGLFYGLQSLLQLSTFSKNKSKKIALPTAKIVDKPLYEWRGLMLDESRHFFGKEKVKELLDWMAFFKLNKFHWHLTDGPGWRIEIKKYPKLTSVGAKGNWHNPDAAPLFYTQADIKEIVAYAAKRHIEIIPEIDMPGHAAAANSAYPEFSGGGSKKYPDFTFNPGKEGTYQYLTDILKEVAELFPSKWIHLGGDEVHYGNHKWKTDSHVQALMKKQNLKTLRDVENYFLHRMKDSVLSLNKKMVGWDEIVDANIASEESMVMWWRHDKPKQLKKALNKGYETVLCPRIPLYFDFVQMDAHKWGRKRRGEFCTLDKLYAFPNSLSIAPKRKKQFVKGIQANVWTERIQNEDRFDFMIYTRLVALAEAAWTQEKNKNYENFIIRLKPVLDLFDKNGLYYFNPFYPELTPEPIGVGKQN